MRGRVRVRVLWVVVVAAWLTGCVSPAAVVPQEAATFEESTWTFDLEAHQVWTAALLAGTGGDTCVMLVAEEPVIVHGGRLVAEWVPEPPNDGSLAIRFKVYGGSGDTVRAVGESPLALDIPSFTLEKGTEVVISTGAPRQNSAVVFQPLELTLQLMHDGALRNYVYSCTRAG